MYSVGDVVVYGSHGPCRVEAVGPVQGAAGLCYTLRPLFTDCVISTPVEGKVPMRPVLSREEALALIDSIPRRVPEVFHSRSAILMAEHYGAALRTQECGDLVDLTMSIYRKRETAEKRRLGAVDERYMKRAEELLFWELSVALDIPPDQVQPFIEERLASGARHAPGGNTRPGIEL